MLSAHGKSAWERLEKTVLLGELALDGRVRPVKGVLSAVLAAKREGWPAVVVPVDNLAFGGQHGRQRTFDRSHPPIERQFTEQHGLFQPLPRLAVGRQHCRRERQIKERTCTVLAI